MYASVNYVINGSDNGLSPDRLKAIIWINTGILSIRPLETNFGEILIDIKTFSSQVKSSQNHFIIITTWI